jgi:hypothetical protein
MRPPTGAPPAARDTSYSVGPRCHSRRRRARHARSFRRAHTQRGARRHRAWARPVSLREFAIDGEFGCRVVRAATRPPAGAAFRWPRRLGALLLPARRLGAGRPRSLPRVAHHRLGGVARRRFARERRRAGACAELLLGGRRRLGRLLACPAVGRPDCGERSLPAVIRGPAGRSGSRLRGTRGSSTSTTTSEIRARPGPRALGRPRDDA